MDKTISKDNGIEILKSLINAVGRNTIIKKLKVDPSNISLWLAKKNIPKKHILDLQQMLMEAEQKPSDYNKKNSDEIFFVPPKALFDAYKAGINRLGIWGKNFWNVFVVDSPKNNSENTVGVTIARLWDGVCLLKEKAPSMQRNFIHWLKCTGCIDQNIIPIGDYKPGKNIDQSQSQISFNFKLKYPGPQDFGFIAYAQKSIQRSKDSKQKFEYLGSSPQIYVEKLHIAVSIPTEIIRDLNVYEVEYQGGVGGNVHAHALCYASESIAGFHDYLEPWIAIKGVDFRRDISIPSKIFQASEKFKSFFDNGRHVFYVELDMPDPLLYYTLIWELPERK